MRRAVIGLAQLIVTLGLALFGPAWTIDFPFAWIYLAVFAASAALITVYLAKRDPALLERRVRAGPRAESVPLQQLMQAVAAVSFVAVFIVASLDHRFGWSAVPAGAAIAGDVAVTLGFFGVYRVFRENTYTAATIEVAAGQNVVSSGPYALVRHPMYASALLLLAGTPFALGSWWALAPLVPLKVALVVRLLDEEALLSSELPGYDAYRRSVRFRLMPGVW